MLLAEMLKNRQSWRLTSSSTPSLKELLSELTNYAFSLQKLYIMFQTTLFKHFSAHFMQGPIPPAIPIVLLHLRLLFLSSLSHLLVGPRPSQTPQNCTTFGPHNIPLLAKIYSGIFL